MIPTQTLIDYPVFGNSATIVKPGDEKYAGGFLPSDLLPAQWHNYFLNRSSSAITCLNAGVSNIEAELNCLVIASGGIPAGNRNNQVYNSVIYQIQANLTDSAPAAFGSAASAGSSTKAARADHVHKYADRITDGTAVVCAQAGNELNIYPSASNSTWINYRGGAASVSIGNGAGNGNLGNLNANLVKATLCGNVCGTAECATNAACAITSSYIDANNSSNCNVNFNIGLFNVGGSSPAPAAGGHMLRVASKATYNPYSNIATINISGNAATATNATNATNATTATNADLANNVHVLNSSTENSIFNLTFINGGGASLPAGDTSPYVIRASCTARYNPVNNTASLNITGNAATANLSTCTCSIMTIKDTSSTEYNVIFTNNGGSTPNEGSYVWSRFSGNLTYIPSSGSLKAPNFLGSACAVHFYTQGIENKNYNFALINAGGLSACGGSDAWVRVNSNGSYNPVTNIATINITGCACCSGAGGVYYVSNAYESGYWSIQTETGSNYVMIANRSFLYKNPNNNIVPILKGQTATIAKGSQCVFAIPIW